MANDKQPTQLFTSLLFPEVFKTFRMAIQPTKLIIAFLTIAVICFAGWLMDFSRTVIATPDTQLAITELDISQMNADYLDDYIENLKTTGSHTELDVYLTNPDRLNDYLKNLKTTGNRTGVFTTLWHFISKRYHHALRALFDVNMTAVADDAELCIRAVGWAIERHPIYCVIFFLIAHAAFSLAGGAICRIAALQFAQGEKPGLTQAVRFSIKKFPSLFAAPLVPVVTILCAGIFVVLLGIAGNIPKAGELIIGAFLLLALLAGAFIAFVSIGAGAGFNLMFPSIAYDGLDCYDAISRTFNYIYVKPWRMGFYTSIAAVYGSVCYIFVRLFAFLLIWLTRCFLEIGIWAEKTPGTSKLAAIWPEPTFGALLGPRIASLEGITEHIAAILIYLFLLVVVGTVVSFIVSFYFSANTIIYALMRQGVDYTSLDTVCRHTDELASDSINSDFD